MQMVEIGAGVKRAFFGLKTQKSGVDFKNLYFFKITLNVININVPNQKKFCRSGQQIIN